MIMSLKIAGSLSDSETFLTATRIRMKPYYGEDESYAGDSAEQNEDGAHSTKRLCLAEAST